MGASARLDRPAPAPLGLDEPLRATHVDLVTVQYRLVTQRLVAQVHRAGGEIWCWTPDDPAAIARLVAMGVDGITTNVPDPGRAAAAPALARTA